MQISKRLVIDPEIKMTKLYISQLKRNYCKKDLYVLCTPTYEKYLFEIIKTKHLSKKYEECYLIGLAEDYETIIEYLKQVIDQLYNRETLIYEEIKS